MEPSLSPTGLIVAAVANPASATSRKNPHHVDPFRSPSHKMFRTHDP
ncbi:hypothetical protein CP97_14715 [Aurantiacibacter atlanticus]|uniref:Uncharacterized protein n=1 Tax=Aurantiacibacter atlanticus TaxID=1648404 RepID=A0A161I460_9SPHN|nr:hypothetical protein CP97_14715 [Aurantiacibacter atlanticus]